MKPLFKDNIFANPQGWAQKCVGSSWRYRWMQSFTVILGMMLGAMVFLVSENRVSASYVGVFVIGAAIMLPLCYLRALRHFVVESQGRLISSKD